MKTDGFISSLLTRLVNTSFRAPWAVIAALVILGAGATALSARLEFRGDFIELLPQDTEEVRDLRFVEARAGGGGFGTIQILGNTRDDRRAFAAELAAALEQDQSLMRYVDYRFDAAFFKKHALWLLPTDQLSALTSDVEKRIAYEKAIANPLYVDVSDEAPPDDLAAIEKKYASEAPTSEYFESKSGEELYVYFKPNGLPSDLAFDRKVNAFVDSTSAALVATHPGIKVAQTGPYLIRVEEDDVMKGDLQRSSVLSAIIAFLVIVIATRRVSALILVSTPIALGILLTFAGTSVTIGHLNPVTGFLAAILTGLGIEYGVHLSMRYWEERERYEALEAMQRAVTGTFAGAMTSAFTNAAAFGVLRFANFAAFQQFGTIAAVGVLLTVLSAYLAGPAVLFAGERLRPPKKPLKPVVSDENKHAGTNTYPRGALIGLVLAVCAFGVFSLFALPKLRFQNDLAKLKGSSPPTELEFHITSELGVIMAPALIHVDSPEVAAKVVEIARTIQKSAPDTHPIQRVAWLGDLVPSDVEAKRPLMERLNKQLSGLPTSVREGASAERIRQVEEMVNSEPFTAADLPKEVRRRFEPQHGEGTFVLVFPRYSGFDVRNLDTWCAALDEVALKSKAAGLTLRLLDTNRIASKIFTLIRGDGPFIMGLAAMAVLCMIAISLRSVKEALQVSLPLYLGMLCTFGAMYLLDVEFNFLNVVVLPNLLSIAVDNSVHLFHRYHEEGPGSLPHVFRTTGVSALVATVTNAAGYGTLITAHHQGLRSIAVLATLGVLCTFIGTTLVFPALLALWEKRQHPESH